MSSAIPLVCLTCWSAAVLPKHVAHCGKTPILTEEQPRHVLESIDTSTRHDCAFARIGAVATAR
jgi:hypothetical protein